MAICYHCGCEITSENEHFVDGNYYCDDCYNDDSIIIHCEHCGSAILVENAIESCDGYICDECRQWDYIECVDCGALVSYSDSYSVRGLDGYVCNVCIDSYCYCDNCDTYVTNDEWDDESECCEQCARRANVNHYHNMKDCGGYRESGTVLQCGVELEIERRGDTSIKAATDYLREMLGDMVTFENDSSLCDGFEIITQPRAFADWYTWREWYDCMDWLRGHGFRSHDGGNCGLHMHIDYRAFGHNNAARDLNIGKILFTYESRIDDFMRLSRRSTLGYCEPYKYSTRVDDIAKAHEITKYGKRMYGRYKTINLTNIGLPNCNTVEFRLGRGTLIPRTFRAWLDMHFRIVENCAHIPVNDTDLYDWFTGAETETWDYISEKINM